MLQGLIPTDLSSALATLTAMITPAVLISACGTLILSTSTRLGRTVDRVRALIDRLEELAHATEEIELFEKRRETLYKQLDLTVKRNRLLQRGMAVFYFGLAMFVATSVSIGLVAATGRGYEWLPAALGLIGAFALFYGSILLIIESRIASNAIFMEMDFILRLSREFVPEQLSNTIDEGNRRSLSRLLRFGNRKSQHKSASSNK